MIHVNSAIRLNESELQFEPVLAAGPGGQHVNKTATAVKLRFAAARSPALEPEVRRRLRVLAGSRWTKSGDIVIHARRHRSQERNRADALQRLVALIQAAAQRPKVRKPTRPSRAARRKRLEDKRRRSGKKRLRGRPAPDA